MVTATVFFSSLSFDLYNGTLPVYLVRSGGFDLNLVGLIVGAASVTQVIGALLAGPFIDRRGARLALRVGPTLQLPAALLFATSQDPALLSLARVLQATGFVLVLPAAYSLLPGLVSLQRRAAALGLVGIGNTLALALGSPLGLRLLARSPFTLFVCSALAGLAALACGSLLTVGARSPGARPDLRLRGAWVPFLAGSFLAFINWGVLLAFLPLQLPAVRAADVGSFLAADALALTMLRIPFGYASDRWGGRTMALLGIAFNLAALAVLLQSRSLAALIAAGAGTGAAAALLLPAIQLELSLRSVPTEIGTAMALSSAALALAVSTGTFLGAPVIDRLGFDAALWLAGAACAAGCVPLLLARRVSRAEPGLAPAPVPLPVMTPTEARVAAVWMEVLGLESVGLGEAFLDLGGESLQAIQVASRLSEGFGLELPLVHVFEQPTVAESARSIDALLGRPDRGPAHPVVAAASGSEARASFAQERIWILEQLDPGTSAYNVPFALRFRGSLDRQALERSLGRLLERQDSLRTRLSPSGDLLIQVVAEPDPRPLASVDLTQLPPGDRERTLRRQLEADARTPFDLAGGPLYRARLYVLDTLDHVLLLVLHHSICDEWSRRVLAAELAAAYRQVTEDGGGVAEAAGPAIRYRDFVTWQRESLLAGRQRELLAFWSKELAEAPRALRLPTDKARPPRRSYAGSTFLLRLPAGLAEDVHRISRSRQVTPFMTLLTVFGLLLQRHSGQSDLLVGTPVANRTAPEAEELVGCFVNTLVLRLNLEGDLSFEELLVSVREGCLAAYNHADLPFERLVGLLDHERDMSRTPIFQAMFEMEAHPPTIEFPDGLEVGTVEITTATSMFDLSLSITETPDGLMASFEYSMDLFEPETIERMAGHFRHLLEAVVGDPERPVGELEILPPAERQHLLGLVAGPELPPGPLVTELLEEHARQRPEHLAVVAGTTTLTYAELNARANRLARHLKTMGVGAGSTVGLCLERSADLVVAVLAAHKARAAYTPLDPAYPAVRLAGLVSDVRPAAVVTLSRLSDRLPAPHGPLVCLDRESEAISRLDGSDLGISIDPNDLAYVIHTSGSSGRPKGVMVDQAALANWARAAQHAYGLNPADRVLQFHSIGFDASVGDVFTTLAAGATLVIAPEAVRTSPPALLDALPGLGLTVADLPTAYWHELVDVLEGRPAPPLGLRLVIIGGERALPDKVRRWQRLVDPRIRLANSYGPTESTVVSTIWWLSAGFADRDRASVPIGQPVGNVRALVLDPWLRPCPIGVPGELYLGGAQLATGYLNLPEETRRSFASCDPFDRGQPERLYRTGDRVRWLEDGNLEFLGRGDRQVKIRGVRVELAEIENALGSHPGVAQTAVEARDRGAGDLGLVAYVVPRVGRPDGVADLRRHLERRLPAGLVPGSIVMLDRLPLTASGKVDHAALPPPGPVSPTGGEAGLGAPSRLEQAVARAWADVLELASVGRNDNFFELGGHSLLAARLVGRLRRDLELEIPIRTLFEAPTVAGLARRIEAGQGQDASGRQALEKR